MSFKREKIGTSRNNLLIFNKLNFYCFGTEIAEYYMQSKKISNFNIFWPTKIKETRIKEV